MAGELEDDALDFIRKLREAGIHAYSGPVPGRTGVKIEVNFFGRDDAPVVLGPEKEPFNIEDPNDVASAENMVADAVEKALAERGWGG